MVFRRHGPPFGVLFRTAALRLLTMEMRNSVYANAPMADRGFLSTIEPRKRRKLKASSATILRIFLSFLFLPENAGDHRERVDATERKLLSPTPARGPILAFRATGVDPIEEFTPSPMKFLADLDGFRDITELIPGVPGADLDADERGRFDGREQNGFFLYHWKNSALTPCF